MKSSDDIPIHSTAFETSTLDGSDGWHAMETAVLPRYIAQCRWFGGKARGPRKFAVLDAPQLGAARMFLLRVEYDAGEAETYLAPLQIARGEHASQLLETAPHAVALRDADGSVIFDAIQDAAFRSALFSLVASGGEIRGDAGKIVGIAGPLCQGAAVESHSRVVSAEQSNSSLIFGDRIFLKLYRRLEEGVNPDAEITRFLTERGHFAHAPAFAGALDYRANAGGPRVLALATGHIPNDGDAWTWALAETRSFFARVAGLNHEAVREPALLDASDISPNLERIVGSEFLARVRQLGTRTAELHLALACDSDDPAFAPEPMMEADALELSRAIEAASVRTFTLLRTRPGSLIAKLLGCEDKVRACADAAGAVIPDGAKIRTHGDFHLGQVLNTRGDFTIIDFEGEPSRSLTERRRKRSPLRDVAGMLRSFHYAAHAALVGHPDRAALEPGAETWTTVVSQAFVGAWLETSAGAIFNPKNRETLRRLLDAFLIEKAIYELEYELNNRPDWLPIPVRGVLRLLGA